MEFFLNKSLTIFAKKQTERVLNTPFQLYLFRALQLKKREDKPNQYQSAQRFFREYTYMKHIPGSLQLSQKQTNLEINSLTINFVRPNIFAIYLPLKLIFFTRIIDHF